MEIDELIKRLQQITKEYDGDTEVIHNYVHIRFDEALLEYVGDKTITKLFTDELLWHV